MNIRERREECGMTQEELSKRVGVVRSAISNWENGTSSPRPRHLFALSKALNCTIDELFSDQRDFDGKADSDEVKKQSQYIRIKGGENTC